ncbi:MAG: tRNA (N6-isopentenyl adenosine(37)-C2)-methylthiotransferase MiaB [Candidatus Wallbacteria bacterium HGW-Wallbacteria-1]|jgi:tRNA-2-methylthio-N6-dimethylallyladenosine synthase|uniref:tRNA-2-methylthio-N(6)-dimethylallyladenosine synthase n=1 Tax=Candidatus Wallbacteria bacterium HGW-Wallbacteria-1 TaxID=2013854 RepID=A0A2N1PSL2_9BACT|nr:MAG: tRNA (N6-isopentenyl adenosine(37)-C2)-methylthiotransferase MiaB [Candidatus Wallbacteria bacterium HGW-Wallbacteria-1]
MKAYIRTFGCQMNKHDSEVLQGLLMEMGYSMTEDPAGADLIFLNTCSIRARAEEKVYGTLGSYRRLRDANPSLIIGVMGCMAQKEQLQLFKRVRHLDLVVSPQAVSRIPSMVEEARLRLSSKKKIEPGRRGLGMSSSFDDMGYVPDGRIIAREGGLSAWVSIMKGCNNFCTYCIVPYVRGREKSRMIPDIVSEVISLVEQGFREVTLLGQNVLAFGNDSSEGFDFADLLEGLQQIDGLWRIRYQTGHPRDYSERTLETIRKCDKVCEHFHLPLQAGSNSVLKAMNRGHEVDFFENTVKRIRELFPSYSLTTDIIVGFPGETEEDFEQTCDLVRRVRFDGAHTFYFSPREGTRAAEMDGQLPVDVRKNRLSRLNEIQDPICREQNLVLEGTDQEILVEGIEKLHGKFLTGRTRTNKITLFPEPLDQGELIGKLVMVRITEGHPWSLKGEFMHICGDKSDAK